MWTTAGAIFSTTSAIKLYLCRRLLGCSWPEIETENMSWVLQVTGEGSLQNTWIKKGSKWISFPSLKVICSITLAPRFPFCLFAQKRQHTLSLGQTDSWNLLVSSAHNWAMGQQIHCSKCGCSHRSWFSMPHRWCLPGLRHCRSAGFSPCLHWPALPLWEDFCTQMPPFLLSPLFWMVYLACMVFSD